MHTASVLIYIKHGCYFFSVIFFLCAVLSMNSFGDFFPLNFIRTVHALISTSNTCTCVSFRKVHVERETMIKQRMREEKNEKTKEKKELIKRKKKMSQKKTKRITMIRFSIGEISSLCRKARLSAYDFLFA